MIIYDPVIHINITSQMNRPQQTACLTKGVCNIYIKTDYKSNREIACSAL